LTIALSVRTTDFKLSAEAGDPKAIATALTAPIRQNTTVRTSPSKGHRDKLTDRDNGGAAAFFRPSHQRAEVSASVRTYWPATSRVERRRIIMMAAANNSIPIQRQDAAL